MVPASTRRKLRAAWTPQRRKEQAERIRAVTRARKAAGTHGRVSRKPSSGKGHAAPQSKLPSRSAEALIYLRKATRYIQDSYKEGAEVTAADTYVFLALRTLEGKV